MDGRRRKANTLSQTTHGEDINVRREIITDGIDSDAL